ncbi:hypothetical protein AVEN_117223-1 [Araneus ventricosus]|uniref:Uncharacterized protein n=1 Tax=Araneus ventricosus TaxID=182803 RepID=A0A4Y2AWP3_ARAVE|nr:hypothetical protein AVEN_117223-1 [Araneus ventricosus]
MKEFGLPLDVNEWRLFIDSSKLSLKMVLLHNGDELPCIPIAYAPHMKETYEHLQQLLHRIEYTQYEWSICADLKVVALLMAFNRALQNFAASFVNGIVVLQIYTISRKTGLPECV